MINHFKDIADIISSFAFGTLTLVLGYVNFKLSDIKTPQDEKRRFQQKANRVTGVIIFLVGICFFISIIFKGCAIFNIEKDKVGQLEQTAPITSPIKNNLLSETAKPKKDKRKNTN